MYTHTDACIINNDTYIIYFWPHTKGEIMYYYYYCMNISQLYSIQTISIINTKLFLMRPLQRKWLGFPGEFIVYSQVRVGLIDESETIDTTPLISFLSFFIWMMDSPSYY